METFVPQIPVTLVLDVQCHRSSLVLHGEIFLPCVPRVDDAIGLTDDNKRAARVERVTLRPTGAHVRCYALNAPDYSLSEWIQDHGIYWQGDGWKIASKTHEGDGKTA